MVENCLTYALRTWRYSKKNEHLAIRCSHFGWFPHFSVLLELQDGSLIKKEYVPVNPKKRLIPPLFFQGVEKITYYRREEVIDGRQNHQS